MKVKAKNIMLIFVIFIVGIFFVFLKKSPPLINRAQIKTSSFIAYPPQFNYRQTINDCGPYNTAAVVRAIKGGKVDSGQFAEKIQWRLPNKYTLPWGLENQLNHYGINVEIPYLGSFSDEEKIFFLREQLSHGKPVIILGEKENFQHYITIFGFDSSTDEFYVYDSLHDKNFDSEKLTVDNNLDLPGNKTLSSKVLIDFWRGGGMYGVYHWYALVANG